MRLERQGGWGQRQGALNVTLGSEAVTGGKAVPLAGEISRGEEQAGCACRPGGSLLREARVEGSLQPS